MRVGDLYFDHPRTAFALQTVTACALGYITHLIQLHWYRENYLLLPISQRGLQPQPMLDYESHSLNECRRTSGQLARHIEPAAVVSNVRMELVPFEQIEGVFKSVISFLNPAFPQVEQRTPAGRSSTLRVEYVHLRRTSSIPANRRSWRAVACHRFPFHFGES